MSDEEEHGNSGCNNEYGENGRVNGDKNKKNKKNEAERINVLLQGFEWRAWENKLTKNQKFEDEDIDTILKNAPM